MRFSVGPIVVAFAGCACLGAGLVGGWACVIVPPPDLPPVVPLPPRILHDSVTPPAGFPLFAWPNAQQNELLVPLVIDDPYGQYDYRVYVDKTQWPDPVSQPFSPLFAVDGGAILSIIIPPQQSRPIDLGTCHVIDVVVAHSFTANNKPDLTGDSVFWPYFPSSASYACTTDDAGAGAATLDGPTESLPVPPLSDGGDR